MPTLDVTLEQVIMLIKQLPREGKKALLEILKNELATEEHPWLKIAGKYKDDPKFNEMLAEIEADRCALDAEMNAYYQRLDAQEEAK